MEQLNSECFRWDNYESSWWSLFDLSWADSMSTTMFEKYVKAYAIGYCDASRLLIRPRDGIAVMFEKNGEQFWFHINDEKLIRDLTKGEL